MDGWTRLVPAVALLVFAICLVAVQPWLQHQPYAVSANITDLSGWSTLSPEGRLWVHLSVRDAISDPRVTGVHVAGRDCENVSGNLISRGEAEIFADCGPGSNGEPYNGTIAMSYLKNSTEFRFDYRVVGLFTGWRS